MGKIIPLIFNLIVIWLRCYVKWAVSGMRKWPSEIDMLISVGRHTWRRRWRRRTVGPNWKNPPKMRFKKFVKLTDHTCACYDLTNFEFEVHAMTGNGCYVNRLWNHIKWTYFWRIFSILKPLCRSVTYYNNALYEPQIFPERKWRDYWCQLLNEAGNMTMENSKDGARVHMF